MSSGRPWNCWYLLLHITSLFSRSHSTKASEIVSTASRSRALASGEASDASWSAITAMPVRQGSRSGVLRVMWPRSLNADKMAVGVAQAETLIEGRKPIAQMAVELALEIVVGMERLGDHAEGHGLAGGLEPKQPEHRRRPVHVAAGEVQAPEAAAGKRLGQLLGEAVGRLRGRGRGEIPQPACEQRKQEAGADEEGDLEPGVAPPIEQRLVNRLEKGQLRVGLGDVADRDDGIGAVEQGEAEHAGLGAEGGERLLRSENGEQIAGARGAERRTRLDIALGIGEQGITPVSGRALGHARGERGLPAFALSRASSPSD